MRSSHLRAFALVGAFACAPLMTAAVACTSFSGEEPAPSTTPDADASPQSDAGPRPEDAQQIGDVVIGLDVEIPTTPPACADNTFLFGNDSLDSPNSDNLEPTKVDAYPFVSGLSTPVTARCVRIHLALPFAGPNALLLGVYANGTVDSLPKEVLAEAKIENPKAGWNAAPLDRSVTIDAGARLWLAALPTKLDVDIKVIHNCEAGKGRRQHFNANADQGLPDLFISATQTMTHCSPAFYLSP